MNKPELVKLETTYYQDGDDMQSNPDNGQEIKIWTEDAGGGKYFVIETKRWAFDCFEEFEILLRKFIEVIPNID